MQYKRISADCHLDLPWMPPDLFTSMAPRDMKDRMPYVVETDDGPKWTAKNGATFGFKNGVGLMLQLPRPTAIAPPATLPPVAISAVASGTSSWTYAPCSRGHSERAAGARAMADGLSKRRARGGGWPGYVLRQRGADFRCP